MRLQLMHYPHNPISTIMNRRNFIHLSALGAATEIIAPTAVLASTPCMAGGVYYTKEAPGRWSKKVGGHLPSIQIASSASGTDIKVITSHEMKRYEHYIVKHIILNDRFEFMTEKMFDPIRDPAPISIFSLGNYRGRIHVLSVCNKHDTWMNLADI